MSLLIYAVKVTLLSGLLYGYYFLFLRNRVFHRFNRLYLLLSVLLSFLLPLITIPVSFAPEKGFHLAQTLATISPGNWTEKESAGMAMAAPAAGMTGSAAIYLLYSAGLLGGCWLLLQSLLYIFRIRRQYPSSSCSGIQLYDTTEPGTPFSFFRQIFWNRNIPFETTEGQQIFRHELYHVRQGHSVDILFLEAGCCLAWFNPWFYLIKKELRTVHEFLADEYAVPETGRLDYAELLVQYAIRLQRAGLSHPFSRYAIRRRVLLLTRSASYAGARGISNRVLAGLLPLLLLALLAFKPAVPAVSGIPHSDDVPFVVVIDAGHGGSDAGAIYKNFREKDITLELAKEIQTLSAQYPFQVVMTRTEDQLPGEATTIREGLLKRVEISNTHKANLFVSLHVNSGGTDAHPAPPGITAFISARKTDPGNREIAGILLQELSPIHTTVPDIKQRSQGIYVLDACSCPAVILECGSMDQPLDLAFIRDKDNQEKTARKILDGIMQYRQTSAR